MADAMSIALSGLIAQGQKLAVSANNIANMSTTGSIPTAENPASTVYKPLSVSYHSLMSGSDMGGVSTTVNEIDNPYVSVYDPSSVYANEEGFIATPNVDLVRETTNMLMTKVAYKANLNVIQAQKDMLGDLFDSMS